MRPRAYTRFLRTAKLAVPTPVTGSQPFAQGKLTARRSATVRHIGALEEFRTP